MVKKTIAGKEYDYTLCPRCEVGILTEKYKDGTHKENGDCDRFFKNLGVRKRATARVLGVLGDLT